MPSVEILFDELKIALEQAKQKVAKIQEQDDLDSTSKQTLLMDSYLLNNVTRRIHSTSKWNDFIKNTK